MLFWKQGSRRLSQQKRWTTFTWSLKSVRTTRIKRMARVREDRRRRLTSCCHICDVRWYSSWMVMTRFYSLFEVLTCVKEECQKSKYLKTNGRREFINAWHRLVRIRCSAPSTTSARWCKALTSFNGIIPSVCTSSQ